MILPPSVFEAENRYARAKRTLTRTCWSISVLQGPTLQSLEPARNSRHPILDASHVHDVPAGFVADPFLLRHDRRLNLFFEVHNCARDKGEIAVATSDDGQQWQYRQVVLSEPHHLSYPFVFENDGEIHLMPESHETGEVALYTAQAFPYRWQRTATLVTGAPFVDPTLVSHEGLHYLFAGEAFRGVLHLYWAEAIRGPWHRHPCSPVVACDSRHARPAGRFVHDGTGIIRLAQSTEPVYGAYVSGFRITALTPRSYSEEPLERYPLLSGSGSGWNAYAMHHLDAMKQEDGGWLAVADGLDLRRRWPRSSSPRNDTRSLHPARPA